MCNYKIARINWLDISKGIAIILMIIGHSSLPKSISNFIWAFHMPLFFIASGWTTNFCKYNFGGFIKQKSKTLLIPFAIYSIIILIIQCYEEINDPMFFLSNGWVSYALWFIPVLYLGLLCAKAIFSIKSISFRYFALISVFVIGIGLSSYNIHFPWSLSSVPYATVFIILGSEIKRFLSQYIQPKWYNIILLFVVTLLISHFWRLDMCFNSILPVIPITIGAISGTLMAFMISMLVEKHFKLLTKFNYYLYNNRQKYTV